jgi:hypothetical protein
MPGKATSFVHDVKAMVKMKKGGDGIAPFLLTCTNGVS